MEKINIAPLMRWLATDETGVGIVIVDIEDKNEEFDVPTEYQEHQFKDSKIPCVKCDSGEATITTETKVIGVKIVNGALIDGEALFGMHPYEQLIIMSLFNKGYLHLKYKRLDTNNDGNWDTLGVWDDTTNSYKEID